MGPESKASATEAPAASPGRASCLPYAFCVLALGSRRLSRLVRCALYALVLVVTFAPRTARADGPMCDRAGASVNVAPEVPPARSGRVEESPCDTDKLLSLLDEVQQPRRASVHDWEQHHVPAWLIAST